MENTEKEMLDMGNHFKKLLDQKNNQINRMAKTIALAYGLTRCIEEGPECAAMCLSSLHQYLTLEVERLMNISED